MEARLKFRTVGAGGLGSCPNSSAPPSRIATLMHSLSSMVHLRRLSRLSFPYRAMHPVMHALSPRHLAVQVRPLRQDGSSARHALAWREHRSTRQFWSTRLESKPPPYLAESSFSARAESGANRTAAESAAVATAALTNCPARSRRGVSSSPRDALSATSRRRFCPSRVSPECEDVDPALKCAGRRPEGEKASAAGEVIARAIATAATLLRAPPL
mmetsp:Transcript_29058/g.85997  ORF Transcript_29058/g.85997 Transcript_29058/m.85997 type:complete len:215 (+) Transcript_29058:1059-1703(+)